MSESVEFLTSLLRTKSGKLLKLMGKQERVIN